MIADKYDDMVTDPANTRMRAASGRVNDDRPLVAFLYELARDHLPVGAIEGMMHDWTPEGCMFTNGWLAAWAQDAADRLTP